MIILYAIEILIIVGVVIFCIWAIIDGYNLIKEGD